MPRVTFVKKAQKDNPIVKKGESYYWWKFMSGGRGGPKRYSKTPPRPSQLTQSEFLGGILGHQETIEDLVSGAGDDFSELADEVRSVVEEVQELGEEQTEKRDNMPENLQDGEVGELLAQRAEQSEEIANELESAADDVDAAVGEIEELQASLDELDNNSTAPDDLSDFDEEGDKDLEKDDLAEELKQRWNDDRESKMEEIENEIESKRDEARSAVENISWDVE